MIDTPEIFDRKLRRQRRKRVAGQDRDTRRHAGFLFTEVAARLADRLLDVDRKFARCLELGCRFGETSDAVRTLDSSKVGAWVHVDPDATMAAHARDRSGGFAVVADEDRLPIPEASVDLVLSNLSLNWVNDLPGALIQANHALRPDGLFQAALFGGETLNELRGCLMDAELEVSGGASPRVAPMITHHDAGALMQRAGFALPVTDFDTIHVTYDNAFRLFADLRAMGETNIIRDRKVGTSPRGLFPRAAALYQERHSGADGRIVATFEVIYLHGWRPDQAQPKPLRPGSAETRLADALGTSEITVPEK